MGVTLLNILKIYCLGLHRFRKNFRVMGRNFHLLLTLSNSSVALMTCIGSMNIAADAIQIRVGEKSRIA